MGVERVNALCQLLVRNSGVMRQSRRIRNGLLAASILLFLPSVIGAAPRRKGTKDDPWRRRYPAKTRPYTPKKYPDYGLKDTVTEAGRRARGMWLTPYWNYRVKPAKTARILKRAGMNAVVIDIKDDWGQLLYPSKIPLSRGLRRYLIKDPKAMVAAYHQHGIYVIARITTFKDSKLPLLRPDLSARIGRGGRRLFRAGVGWLDAYSAEVQDYLVDIARDIESFGFDEVQFDYVRFPKGRAGKHGIWMHQDKRDRATLIADFLEKVDRAIRIPISVATYGLTTLVDGDPRGLGQTLERMARHAEILSPMMYANGMTSYFKGNTISKGVYSLIHCGLWRARQKAPEVILRPYLQAYANSVPFYGPEFIKKQVLAAYRAGSQGFLFWNPPMKMRTMTTGVRMVGKTVLADFPNTPERYKEKRNGPSRWCRKRGAVFGK